MIKGVLFDLDGTLLDTLEDLYQSVNAALAACGFPERTRMEVRSFVGNGVRNLMVRSVPDGEENPKFEECFQKFREHYAVHLNDHTAPYAGIMELLAKLREKEIPTAVVSNKSDAAVKKLCQETFGDLVPLAIGESERVQKKPAPDTIIEAAEIDVPLKDCVYVGDSEVDLATAENAGIPCISVSWGFRDRELLESLGAKTLLDTVSELRDCLLNMAAE